MQRSTHYLNYQPPLAWEAMLGFFAARAVPGVERVAAGIYRRLLGCGTSHAMLEVSHDAARQRLVVMIETGEPALVRPCLARIGEVFDLTSDLAPIERHLARDPLLAQCIARQPGLRPPGAWTGFELAVRAVLGQQITVLAARKLTARLVEQCGERVSCADAPLTHLFPTAGGVADADLSSIGMPQVRKRTLQAVARAVIAEPTLLLPHHNLDTAVGDWQKIPGIGAWTAHYIALRALRANDAFPASDIGLLRAAASDGQRPTPVELTKRAEAWRPWRAYAAQHLWSAAAGPEEE